MFDLVYVRFELVLVLLRRTDDVWLGRRWVERGRGIPDDEVVGELHRFERREEELDLLRRG